MSIITAIESQKNRKRVNVFIDGKYSFSLTQKLAEKMRLTEGMPISPSQAETYTKLDSLGCCMSSAELLLSHRSRSEKEMRSRLERLGHPEEIIEQTIIRLKELKLLDDEEFARYWVENRASFSPRSRSLIRAELCQKGVDSETINTATNPVDEGADAYHASQKKANALQECEYTEFRRKVMSYLQRRGFGYGVSKDATNRLWQELKGENNIPLTDDTSEEEI